MIFASVALAALVAAAPVSVDQPAGRPLSGNELDARTNEVSALLRCPVCQGLSVADSPATMARNMKQEVREKLAQGFDQEQIIASFERSYGEFVRLRPPLRGANWLVWVGPAIFLLGGAVVIGFALRRARRPLSAQDVRTATNSAADRGALPDDPRLADAIRRVRALADGSPETPSGAGLRS
jgi:cytochrome c-type biogenesis protein CcmH